MADAKVRKAAERRSALRLIGELDSIRHFCEEKQKPIAEATEADVATVEVALRREHRRLLAYARRRGTAASQTEVVAFQRARRLVLRTQRQKSEGSLCYRCHERREHMYPMQLPGFMFAYEGDRAGAPTDIRVCADCLRDVCDLLSRWVIRR